MRKCYNLKERFYLKKIFCFIYFNEQLTFAYGSVRSVTIHMAHEPTAGVIDGEPLIVPHDILPLTSSASK
jgi:hypothetical protein